MILTCVSLPTTFIQLKFAFTIIKFKTDKRLKKKTRNYALFSGVVEEKRPIRFVINRNYNLLRASLSYRIENISDKGRIYSQRIIIIIHRRLYPRIFGIRYPNK